MIKILFLVCLLYLPMVTALAQQKRQFQENFTAVSMVNTSNEENVEQTGYKEEVSKRTRYSRSFRNSKGDIRQEFSKKPLCYERNGTFQPIVSNPTANTDGSWKALDQEVGTSLDHDGMLKLFFSDKDTLTLKTLDFNGIPIQIGNLEAS
jgi:hypothetical protein